MSIKVENLTKYYGNHPAVKNISFEINTGEIVGFLGPNGAGKSTTMKMITTYLTPTEGKISVEGNDTGNDPKIVRAKIGYLPEQNPLYLDMNVLDYLKYAAKLESVPKEKISSALNRIIKDCGLEEVKHMDIGQLSKGYRQRVGLAQAMIHDPDVLILDEPTSGLDPNQIIEIRNLIKRLGKQKTLILSTHILQEVQAVCDRVLIINKGEIVADGSPDELQKKFQGQVLIKLTVKKGGELNGKFESEIKSIPGIEKISQVSEDEKQLRYEILASKGSDLREAIFNKLVEKKLTLLELYQETTSLEDIFRELTIK